LASTDNLRGIFLGLAIGDALGAAVEFKSPGTFPPVTGYRSGGPHVIPVGGWTDDTSMALALADSIATAGWDLNDQAERYLAWWHEGKYSVIDRCFDIGNTTSNALKRFEMSREARSSGDASEGSCGNGSSMRLAPVAIAYANLYPDRITNLATKAMESSLPTHAHPKCTSACAYLATVLAALAHGEDREAVLSPAWLGLKTLRDSVLLHPSVLEIAEGSFRQKTPPKIRGTGYVIDCLEAALWAFHSATSFEEAVLKAVNLGHDADTTGAVAGQLAGAYWGADAVPQNLKDNVARKELLQKFLEPLIAYKG